MSAIPAPLTRGPLLFNWTPERWRDFYARIAYEAPVDRVCIGEVVCSKRLPFIVDAFACAVERRSRCITSSRTAGRCRFSRES